VPLLIDPLPDVVVQTGASGCRLANDSSGGPPLLLTRQLDPSAYISSNPLSPLPLSYPAVSPLYVRPPATRAKYSLVQRKLKGWGVFKPGHLNLLCLPRSRDQPPRWKAGPPTSGDLLFVGQDAPPRRYFFLTPLTGLAPFTTRVGRFPR